MDTTDYRKQIQDGWPYRLVRLIPNKDQSRGLMLLDKNDKVIAMMSADQLYNGIEDKDSFFMPFLELFHIAINCLNKELHPDKSWSSQ